MVGNLLNVSQLTFPSQRQSQDQDPRFLSRARTLSTLPRIRRSLRARLQHLRGEAIRPPDLEELTPQQSTHVGPQTWGRTLARPGPRRVGLARPSVSLR